MPLHKGRRPPSVVAPLCGLLSGGEISALRLVWLVRSVQSCAMLAKIGSVDCAFVLIFEKPTDAGETPQHGGVGILQGDRNIGFEAGFNDFGRGTGASVAFANFFGVALGDARNAKRELV